MVIMVLTQKQAEAKVRKDKASAPVGSGTSALSKEGIRRKASALVKASKSKSSKVTSRVATRKVNVGVPTSPERIEELRKSQLKSVESDLSKLRGGVRVKKSLSELMAQKQFLSRVSGSSVVSSKPSRIVSVGSVSFTEDEIKRGVHRSAPLRADIVEAFDNYKSSNIIEPVRKVQSLQASVRLAESRAFDNKLAGLPSDVKNIIRKVSNKDLKWSRQRESRFNFFKNIVDKGSRVTFGVDSG